MSFQIQIDNIDGRSFSELMQMIENDKKDYDNVIKDLRSETDETIQKVILPLFETLSKNIAQAIEYGKNPEYDEQKWNRLIYEIEKCKVELEYHFKESDPNSETVIFHR